MIEKEYVIFRSHGYLKVVVKFNILPANEL